MEIGRLTDLFRATKPAPVESKDGLCRLLVKLEPAEYHGLAPSQPNPMLQRVKRELLSPSSCVTNDNNSGFHDISVESAHQPGLMTALLMIQQSSKKNNNDSIAKPEAVGAPEKLITALDMLCPTEMVAASTPDMKLMTALHMIEDRPFNVKSEPLAQFPDLEQLKENAESFRNSVREELLDYALHRAPESSEDDGEPTQAVIDSEEVFGQPSQSQKEIKPRNTNPGRRVQGGRLYDSALGKTCHWCRQKTVEHHVKCRECTIYYCGPCLMNRMGENIREELCEGVKWLCPKCRNGCGPGCENCCNCGPCRKACGKSPTGQMIGAARVAGFDNAHDYLVHLETGESPEEVAQRKVGRDWINGGRFKCRGTSESLESGDGASLSSDCAEEFTLNEETSTQLHQGILDMKFVRKFVEVCMSFPAAAAAESQKRKRVAMRTPFPAKRSQLEASSRTRCRDVDSILSRLTATGQKETVRVTQKLKTKEKCTEDDASGSNEDNGVRLTACKREFVENDDRSNFSELENSRRKLDGDQRLALLHEFLSSRSSVPTPFSEVKCKVEPATGADPRRGARDLNGVSSASMECPIDPQGTDYRMKLKSALAQTFDAKELEALDYSVRCRKPVQKLRHMRGRIVDVVTEYDGLSYLDHHQDFAAKLEEAESPPEKLALLRGFFFWLQHSCMEGAFRPWPSSQSQARHQNGDCIETEGPDCQVTAVLLQLDEGKEANRQPKRKFGLPLQSLIPFQAKKNLVQNAKPKMKGQLTVPPAMKYRVVLGLPAPALHYKM